MINYHYLEKKIVMNIKKNAWEKIISWIVSILTAVVLVLGAVRIVLSPLFIEIEYRMPNFPEDPYGFTKEDRLLLADIARRYLLNDAGIAFLGDLRFPEGEQVPALSCQFMQDCTKMYNDRELQHMIDVKKVVKSALNVWYGSMILLLFFAIWSWYGKRLDLFRKALVNGGWLTLILMGAILVSILVAFGVVFVLFHQIFFESGTWSFYYSDTLIRLFPERFWRDIFLVVGGLTAGMSLLLITLLPRVSVRQDFAKKTTGEMG
jgi:integral membrane protein (TIGR01906 family)